MALFRWTFQRQINSPKWNGRQLFTICIFQHRVRHHNDWPLQDVGQREHVDAFQRFIDLFRLLLLRLGRDFLYGPMVRIAVKFNFIFNGENIYFAKNFY